MINFCIMTFPCFLTISLILFCSHGISVPLPQVENDSHSYTVVIEGFDWGAAASKVIIPVKDGMKAMEKEKEKEGKGNQQLWP